MDREIYATFDGHPARKDDLLRYADACAKVIDTQCPVIADELEGMAEGSGLRLEEHVLLTLHEELYHRGVLPPIPHCTAVAVGRPGTRDGIAYVGQTWDWMPSVAGMSCVLEWRRTDGPSLLAYAFPGLWAGAGLNANGLALCWTSAELRNLRRHEHYRHDGLRHHPPHGPSQPRRSVRRGVEGIRILMPRSQLLSDLSSDVRSRTSCRHKP